MLRDGSAEVEGFWCGVDSNDAHEDKCARLHRRLQRIKKARGALDAQEAAALREAESLRVWRHYGYSSLLEYMEMELGYSPREALERLRVAKAIVELPVIAQKMEQGDLSFSAARELTRVATAETEGEWLEAADDKNLREVEALVSGHQRGEKPTDPVDPKLRKTKLRYDDIEPETKVLLRQAREILERERGERISDNDFLRTFARMVVDGVASPERKGAPYQIAVMTCAECKRGWQDGGGLTVEMSPAMLETALCDALHIGRVDDGDEDIEAATHDTTASTEPAATISTEPEAATTISTEHAVAPSKDSQRNAATSNLSQMLQGQRSLLRNQETDRPQTGRTGDKRIAKAKRVRTAIPAALRRLVKARDHGKCCVPWCRSSRNVDQHHMRRICDGGKHTADNIISLCESHHLAHHAGALIIEGTATNLRFTRRAHSSFALAERAVDTARALRELGFDKREVNAAMDRTRTHVGTTELTLEQWIKIALGYCPKPKG